MSMSDLRLAMTLVPNCSFFYTSGGASEKDISLSENSLGIVFSPQCKEYYRLCNYVSFESVEIFGINPHDQSGVLEGNAVAYSLFERANYDLPREWIPLLNYNDGTMAFLDYSRCNSAGEPPVIIGYYEGKRYRKIVDVAEDIGEFVLDLVKRHLSVK